MARELGVDWRSDPAERVVHFCVQRISGWLSEFSVSSFPTMEKVERLVCAKLKLVVEEVDSEEKMDFLIGKYAVQKGEGAFAHLREELGEKTFGVLMRREKAGPTDRDRFIAVVDCRGDKQSRRYFSRWHEIAHMLTLYDQLALPFHRSQGDGSPTERLMDMIAGEIGFYAPLFQPALDDALAGKNRVSFETVDSLQAKFAPTASFQSTLFACLNRSKLAAAYLETGLGYKKAEQQLISSGQLLLGTSNRPEAKLRVLDCSSNDAARAKRLRFHQNMEVPRESVVFRDFYGSNFAKRATRENLNTWSHSDGRNLGNLEMEIETRRIRDRLIVLANPV